MINLRDVEFDNWNSIGAMRLVKTELATNFRVMDRSMYNQGHLAYQQDQRQENDTVTQCVFQGYILVLCLKKTYMRLA
jgi:hypothetical protein